MDTIWTILTGRDLATVSFWFLFLEDCEDISLLDLGQVQVDS